MPRGRYDRSVFVNCPFDEDYRPILDAILFCLVDCELTPRIASERLDSGEIRLEKIVELIRSCQYSIHDLSRVQTGDEGGYARLNMPFELGIDYGFAQAGSARFARKRLLVVATDQYKYQAALSDIAGWDIRAHAANFETAIRHVRTWLAANGLVSRSTSQIVGDYLGFQEWDYERLLHDGWEDADIQERATPELLESTNAWVAAGRPMTF